MTPATLEDMQAALANKTAIVIDIREPHEHATGVAQGAVLIPMSQLGGRLSEIPKPSANDPEQPAVLLSCRTQARSANVAGQLQQMGYTNVRYIHGGMSEWAHQGLPMVQP